MTRTLALLLAALVLASAALAAPVIGPLGDGVHGIACRPAPDAPVSALAVAATSLDPGDLAPPELPQDLAQRLGDTPVGAYVREQWDKGAFLIDSFSTRWTGTLKVDREGEVTFYLTTDDGARMWVDGEPLIDVWVPRPRTTSEEKTTLTAGEHQLVVEFYEGGGAAVAQLEWSAEGIDRQIIPAERVSFDGQPGWRAEYFRNTELQGEPAVALTEETIDHDWGEGGVQVGAEEPGEVVLEWTRLNDSAVVGRVHSGPESQIILRRAGTEPGLAVRVLGVEEGDAEVHPPTERSYVFVAGVGELPDLSEAQARATLRDAWLASLSPNLPPGPPDAEGWISLFNGTDTTGWKPRWGDSFGNWVARDGELVNDGHGGTDLMTEWTLLDYDLHIEFNYPAGSNSGVYFQGRYEVQLLDSFGGPLESHQCGALYGIQAPSQNVTRPAGEWQSFDAAFRSATLDDDGRVVPARLSLTHNDVLTIDDAAATRATGGEMDRDYLRPGPVLLQGTHGPVRFRNIRVRLP